MKCIKDSTERERMEKQQALYNTLKFKHAQKGSIKKNTLTIDKRNQVIHIFFFYLLIFPKNSVSKTCSADYHV
jgi:hypothetical protein